MHHIPAALFPLLDPSKIIDTFGPWALLAVCVIVFAETGLLIGFVLPGDTLLVITGVLTFTGTMTDQKTGIQIPIYLVCLAISFAAWLGGEGGYFIGRFSGPRIFERKETGIFSRKNVDRTNAFFDRFGGLAVILARFVPIVRTFAPVAAGVGHMHRRRYALYNAVGAVIWGSGVTLAGFLLGYIPPLKDFVVNYIDLILLGAVVIAIVPTAFHTIQAVVRNRRAQRDGENVRAEDVTADDVVADDVSADGDSSRG